MSKSHDAPGKLIATWWRRLRRLPFGRTIFSIAVGRIAPYSGTIGARIEDLEPGYARWSLRDRRRMRNHLNSIHAVALANLAEITSGTAMLVSLPADVRGIVTRLSIEFVKKARGKLVAECRCDIPRISSETSFVVRSEVRDQANDVVARAEVVWLLAPRTPTVSRASGRADGEEASRG